MCSGIGPRLCHSAPTLEDPGAQLPGDRWPATLQVRMRLSLNKAVVPLLALVALAAGPFFASSALATDVSPAEAARLLAARVDGVIAAVDSATTDSRRRGEARDLWDSFCEEW